MVFVILDLIQRCLVKGFSYIYQKSLKQLNKYETGLQSIVLFFPETADELERI